MTLSESPEYLDGDEDTRFSVVDDERVYQYRLDHETDPWWFDYRTEAGLSGFVLTLGTVGVGVIRRLEGVWD
ncbi:hypothetical protein [Halogranum rubrum]|uniref:Uncharacterized protein n=1 Tax=Halogranum salarium B-1 TaxID=1210908 RepID=J3F078_9EURY|nr:hypothetical protein [Halogranum salarium]EJN61427.1 hypothetical protein HSB1_04680 [Halogranum salarium B-1]